MGKQCWDGGNSGWIECCPTNKALSIWKLNLPGKLFTHQLKLRSIDPTDKCVYGDSGSDYFKKYLLTTCGVQNAILGAVDTAVNKTDTISLSTFHSHKDDVIPPLIHRFRIIILVNAMKEFQRSKSLLQGDWHGLYSIKLVIEFLRRDWGSSILSPTSCQSWPERYLYIMVSQTQHH